MKGLVKREFHSWLKNKGSKRINIPLIGRSNSCPLALYLVAIGLPWAEVGFKAVSVGGIRIKLPKWATSFIVRSDEMNTAHTDYLLKTGDELASMLDTL